MTDPRARADGARRILGLGIVLTVDEDVCRVRADGQVRTVGYATMFPSPRTERVSPGHLVAVAAVPDGVGAVIWRWYDAVVTGQDGDSIRLWEPAHGYLSAKSRSPQQQRVPGTRAYLSAGLPGAEWWVAGPAALEAEEADVELDEVERFCTEHGVWAAPE